MNWTSPAAAPSHTKISKNFLNARGSRSCTSSAYARFTRHFSLSSRHSFAFPRSIDSHESIYQTPPTTIYPLCSTKKVNIITTRISCCRIPVCIGHNARDEWRKNRLETGRSSRSKFKIFDNPKKFRNDRIYLYKNIVKLWIIFLKFSPIFLSLRMKYIKKGDKNTKLLSDNGRMIYICV